MTMDSFFSGPTVPAILFSLAMVAAIPGVVSFSRGRKAERDIERRLERRGTGKVEPIQKTQDGLFTKLILGVGNRARPQDDEEVSLVKSQLMQAGFTGPNAVSHYYVIRLLCVVIPQLLLLATLPFHIFRDMKPMIPIFTSLSLLIVGIIGPTFFIDGRIKKRAQECSAGFPDMMDLLVACVEAGLSLDASVQRVGEELEFRHPIIASHLRTLSLELRAGRARKVAWRRFADRMSVEEAGSLATMLRQAEEMGTSLGATLRVFSADMRRRRTLMAEEKAMALPAKMTLPLILFVFPVLLGVLILPAVVSLGDIMG